MRVRTESFLERIRALDPAKVAAEEAERRQREGAALRKAQRQAVAQLGIPEKHMELLRSGLGRETHTMRVLAEPAVLTVLSGTPGCGKTVAAAAWLWDWVHDENSWKPDEDQPQLLGRGLFVSAAKLSRWHRYEDAAMDKLLLATRLVVDDLGVEYLDDKGNYMALLDEVIHERHANGRATVMTTNLGAPEFRGRYGERIADRIREDGRFVSITDPSMRRRAATEKQGEKP